MLPPRSQTALPVVPRRAVLGRAAQRPRARATALTTEFWKLNAPPAAGMRVEFAGSPVILEYYAGRGLQIQPLANFGRANAAWSSCKSKADKTCTKLRAHLDAMIALASQRGTFTTWEYFFDFDVDERPVAGHRRAGAVARVRPHRRDPLPRHGDGRAGGVRDAAARRRGPARRQRHALPHVLLRAGPVHLQRLPAGARGSTTTATTPATRARAGHSHARWLVPRSDTGSWSRYSLGGPESTPSYHVLLRDILANLCKRIGTPEYCTTADRFTQHLAASAALR